MDHISSRLIHRIDWPNLNWNSELSYRWLIANNLLIHTSKQYFIIPDVNVHWPSFNIITECHVTGWVIVLILYTVLILYGCANFIGVKEISPLIKETLSHLAKQQRILVDKFKLQLTPNKEGVQSPWQHYNLRTFAIIFSAISLLESISYSVWKLYTFPWSKSYRNKQQTYAGVISYSVLLMFRAQKNNKYFIEMYGSLFPIDGSLFRVVKTWKISTEFLF